MINDKEAKMSLNTDRNIKLDVILAYETAKKPLSELSHP